jgi:hypothetical protein
MGRQRFFGNKAHGVIYISGTTAYDIADGEVIVIGDKTYEWDVAGDGVTAGNVQVDISGDTSAADAIATLVGVINANKPSIPVTAAIHPGFADCAKVIADNRGAAGNLVFTTTMATGTSSITGSGNLQYGENGGSQIEARGTYTVEAEDVLATTICIDTGLASPRFADLTIRTAGVDLAWDGALTIVGAEIRLDQAGSNDWSAADVITWTAWE